MKCFYCNDDVIWQNDYDMEDIDPDSTHNIISYYDCKGCGAWYEIYTDKKKDNGQIYLRIQQWGL